MFICPEKWISDNFLTIIDTNMCDTSILLFIYKEFIGGVIFVIQGHLQGWNSIKMCLKLY